MNDMTGPIDYAWATLQKAWYDNEAFRGNPEDEEAHMQQEEQDLQDFHARTGPTPLSPEEIMRFTRPELEDMGRSIEMELSRREVMRGQRRGGPQQNVASGPGQTMGASAEGLGQDPNEAYQRMKDALGPR